MQHTLGLLLVFPGLDGLERGGTGDDLVREVTLVLAAVDLLVSVRGFA